MVGGAVVSIGRKVLVNVLVFLAAAAWMVGTDLGRSAHEATERPGWVWLP